MPSGEILEWDSPHVTVEKWTNKKKNAQHLGEFNPYTGKQLPGKKGWPIKNRKLGEC